MFHIFNVMQRQKEQKYRDKKLTETELEGFARYHSLPRIYTIDFLCYAPKPLSPVHNKHNFTEKYKLSLGDQGNPN